MSLVKFRNLKKIGEDVTNDIHHGLRIIESRTHGLINFVKATKSLTDIPKPNLRRIMVSDLLERISTLYKAKFKGAGVKFEKEIIPTNLFVEADLELVEQVVINLIQNALDAMKETKNPSLLIRASKNESDNIEISISDNGTGISDDVIERIFLAFYFTKPNSSGIGLSLSQQIMMLHHGRIEVKTAVNKGTTFTLIF
jgi:two-component system, NtrC family, nitrogen regulation sensor histidine kinase NtrY